MVALKSYSLQEVRKRLNEGSLPFSGVTEQGGCEFHFLSSSYYAGIAMHTGSRIRPELKESLSVKKSGRLREEDPYADTFIKDFPVQIIALDSRFEYDLNCDPQGAIYPFGKLKWGLNVWNRDLGMEERKLSIIKHREFHDLVDLTTLYLLKQNRYALIFDMHSYCYQREEEQNWFDDPRPEINLGTIPVNKKLFRDSIEQFLKDLSGVRIEHHQVRVAENEVFPGGYLSRRLSKKWYERVLVLAIEYKKIFMNEWTGELYSEILDVLVQSFRSASGNLINSALFTDQTS
ncbi:N-formylglutamate amidohydrolase [Bacteroidota bacterium]